MNTIGLLAWLLLGVVYFLGFKICARRLKAAQNSCNERLENLESKRRDLKEEYDRLEEIDQEIRERELSLAGLYEFTKKMSHGLRFEEIFQALTSFLRESLSGKFSFTRGELIVVKPAGSGYNVDRVYQLLQGEHAAVDRGVFAEPISKKTTYDFDQLLLACKTNRKGVFITVQEEPGRFQALRIAEGVQTFAAISLMNENKIAAILAMEDMPHHNFDKFSIISVQFALEIKKVLLYETVESLAITDGLTGLCGKRYFLERLDEELTRSRAHAHSFTFLMADIDYFKRCNDTYGHLVGDVVLREIGSLIKESVREIDLVARYGGEEFAIMLPDTKAESGAAVAERIREKIEGHVFRAYDETLRIAISIGVASFPDDGQDANTIIDNADSAMYRAKSEGRNRVKVFKPEHRVS